MPQTDPKINIINAKRGWDWLMQSGDIIGEYRGAFFIIALVWSALLYLQVIPIIGEIIFVLLMPVLQAGAMYAVAKAGNKQEPKLGDLFVFLNSSRRSVMLLLGAILLLCFFIAAIILSLMVTTLFPEITQLQNIENIQIEKINLADFWLFLCVTLVMIAFVSLAIFFAIPRVAFDHQSPVSALSESIRAGLKNWRALLCFGLAQIVVSFAAILILLIFSFVITLVLGEAGLIIQSILTNLLFMMLQLLVCGGQYLAWQDVFGHPDNRTSDQSVDDQPPSDSDDQLIA